jgi:hypothetical protein
MQRATRAEHILDRLVRNDQLTENGKAAFIAAVDPYHDKSIEHWRGWPDNQTAPSICRVQKKTMTVTSTGAGASLVISTHPVLNSLVMNLAERDGNVVETILDGVSTDTDLGGVVVEMFNSSTSFARSGLTFRDTMPPEPSYISGLTRLCGMGVEVTDVTSELYRQGTCTIAQLPESDTQVSTFNVDAQVVIDPDKTLSSAHSFQQIAHYPIDPQLWMYYEGTVQWKSEQGAYIVVPFLSSVNPPRPPEYRQPFYPADTTLGYDAIVQPGGDPATNEIYVPHFYNNLAGATPYYTPNRWVPTNSKCIALTGLAAQSTFTITVSYWLETFPDMSSLDLITIARPSAAEDALAMRLISEAMMMLPIAVPVGDNEDGDWFYDLVRTILPAVAPVVGGMIGGAPGAALGSVLSTAFVGALPGASESKQPQPPSGKPQKTVQQPAVRPKRKRRRPVKAPARATPQKKGGK